MPTSNEKLLTPSPQTNKILAIVFLLLGIVGFFDAAYLTIEHYRNVLPVCNFISGCDVVLLSKYSMIGPIPLALLGVVYYSVIIFGSILFLDLKINKILHLLAAYTLVGILASVYFLYLQVFVIKALCLYCLISALTSTLLFVNGLITYKLTAENKTA